MIKYLFIFSLMSFAVAAEELLLLESEILGSISPLREDRTLNRIVLKLERGEEVFITRRQFKRLRSLYPDVVINNRDLITIVKSAPVIEEPLVPFLGMGWGFGHRGWGGHHHHHHRY